MLVHPMPGRDLVTRVLEGILDRLAAAGMLAVAVDLPAGIFNC